MRDKMVGVESLERGSRPIRYIGIYELSWLIDDNLLDCEGIIVAYDDERYLVKSWVGCEGEADFAFYEFNQHYECRKILSTPEEPIRFVRKEEEAGAYRVLRFRIGDRPILITAVAGGMLTVGISHRGSNDEWLEFGNNNLLNDADHQ